MLGPQWSKQELERFYEGYRKHGKDWRKVSIDFHDLYNLACIALCYIYLQASQ